MWHCRISHRIKPVYSNLSNNAAASTLTRSLSRHMSTSSPDPSSDNIMRIAHITDLHWLSKTLPTPWEMLGKRIIGYLNLYVMGRRHYFQDDVRTAMLEHLREQRPDVVLITGDLTSTALEQEFKAAREGLQDLLTTVPVFLIPGNHDAYTRDTVSQQPIRRWFGQWMGGEHIRDDQLPLFRHRFLHILAMDPCRPTVIGSNGLYPPQQLHALQRVLGADTPATTSASTANDSTAAASAASTAGVRPVSAAGDTGCVEREALSGARYGCVGSLAQWMHLWPRRAVSDAHAAPATAPTTSTATSVSTSSTPADAVYPPFTLLATHYPVVDRSGGEYTSVHKNHGAANNAAFLDILAAGSVLPAAICHGHDHLGMNGAVAVPRRRACPPAVHAREEREERDRAALRATLPHRLINYWRDAAALFWPPTHAKTDATSTTTTTATSPASASTSASTSSSTSASASTSADAAAWDHGPAYIPVFNPGSGALAQAPPEGKGHKAWHRQAGYCLYTVTRHELELGPMGEDAEARVRAIGVATGDGYELRVQQYIHDGAVVRENEVPFTYLRPEGQ